MSLVRRRNSVPYLSFLSTIVFWTYCSAFVFGQDEASKRNRKLAAQSTQNERDELETFGGFPFITNAGPYTVQTGASNPLNGVDIGTESAPALVDIDNDGDLDLFAGEDDGTINYFENTGSASAATYVQRTGGSNPFNGIDVGDYAYPAVVDIDNDGDYDVFISDESTNIFYYKNTGSVSAPTFTLQTGGANPFNGATLSIESKPGFIDIDNDADYDAFVGEDNGIINYFENTGSVSAPAFVERTGVSNPFNGVDVGGYTSIALFDDGGDSDYDAYVGEAGGVINFFENTGTASVPTFVQQTGASDPFDGVSVGSYSRITLGDLDNDTDLDVIIGENDGVFNYYLNTELPIIITQFVEQTGASNPFDGEDLGSFTAPAMIDIDNDGDLDVFSGESGGEIFYYENTGSAASATFTERTGVSNPFDGVNVGGGSKIVLVDIDNDGDYDTFIGESDGVVNYYENTGSAGSPTFVQRTGGSNPFDGVDIGSFSPPEFGDLDNDGDFDAFVGDVNGNVHYFENTGSAASPTFVERTGASNPLDGEDIGGYSTVGLYDNDYDGDLDVFIGGGTGVINYFENTGSAASAAYTEVTGSSNPFYNGSVSGFSSIKLADLDDDGDADALIGDSNGNISYFLNTDNPVLFGPGGITTDLALWLKADNGVTETSGNVSTWADQSGNSKDGVDNGAANLPSISGTDLNYNPIIEFDASNTEGLKTSSLFGTSSHSDLNIFVVAEVNTITDSHLFIEGPGTSRVGTDLPWTDNVINWDAGGVTGSNRLSTAWSSTLSTPYIWGFEYESSNSRQALYRDGATFASDATAPSFSLSSSNEFELAATVSNAEYADVDVAELIVIQGALTDTEQDKIETYLSVKYGISQNNDYLASDGTTLWDATSNSTYHNDVAGIGRDDDSSLDQKQSTSHSGGIVEIGLGTLAADNAANANTFSTDLDFMIWGHDDASSSVATAFSGSSANTRMARIWKVEETGTVGTVEIQIPDSYGATYLIVSSSSSLTSPTETALSDNGDGTMSTTVNFADGQFFTFGASTIGPGGVTADLELWLKADAGVTESSNVVSAWADQTGNSNDASQGTPSYQPTYESNALNYNPGILFAEDFLGTSLDINATSVPDVSVVFVYTPSTDPAGALWGISNGDWNRCIWDDASWNNSVSIGTSGSTDNVTNLFVSGQANITTVAYDEDASNGSSVYVNGVLQRQFTADQASLTANNFSVGTWGGGAAASGKYQGRVFEGIVYSALLSSQDLNQVQTYLGLKYGISLAHDYEASDATTLWDATTNATYHNDVAGIGRDDLAELNQKQSTSQSGGIVEIGLGTLAADNASNANTFSTDLNYLIWGHDNASTTVATVYSGSSTNTRMARVWKVEETGTVGTVEIQIPDTYDATHLIVSANSSLTSPTEVVLTDNGDGTRSTTVDFTDGQFFSFGVGPTPGGVSADIELWLKADAGVTEAAGDVTTWADQSGSGRDAVDNGAANLPSMSGTDVNYNPIIEFDGSNSEGLKTSSVFGTATHSNVNLFLVAKTNTTGTDWALIEGTDVSSNRVGLHLPHTSTIYWDAGGASGSNRLQTAWTETIGQEYIWSFEYESATPEQTIYRDGASIATDATVASFNFSSSYEFQIASELIDGAYYDGEIAEIIVYPGSITDTEQDRIESYLAIKYGVTLSHDYLASDATTLWDATTNAAHHNDVFGIGRDDVSALYQKQSGASIVTAALGTLAADNTSNANTISTDLTFLVMGHNAGALTESAVTVGAYTADQLARKWFAEETNDTGSTLEFKFDLTGLTVSGTTAAEFKLVLDTDNDPSNGTRQIISAASFASDVVTFSSVDVEDNDYLILLTDYDLAPVGPPVSDGATADGVLGQPDFDSATGNNGGVSSTALNGPTYFAMGPTGKIFVSDSKNHRVMRWSSANAAVNGSAAEAVLGQADFTSNTANRGSAVAANTMYDPTGLFVTSTGALFVSDSQNNRILRFDNAESVSSGAAADGVLGQADFVSFEANRRQNVAANSLRWPKDLYVDSGGRLWAVDWLNHRVLRYDSATSKADGADADGVIGQPDFTSREIEWKNQTDANSLVYPAGVYVDGAGRLWVNDAGNSRVLRFDTAASKANGADADGVLGQADFTSWRVNRGGETAANTLRWPDAGIDGDNQGGIWVADRWGDRVLWYEDAATKLDGAAADGVLGQPDFVTSHGTVDNDSFNGAHDVFIDSGSDQIWIIDNAHNRVLRFDATAASLSKIPDGPEIEEIEIPVMYALYQNYPNPFNPSTTIGFDLPESVHVRINVYDMLGRPVHTLIDEDMPAGKHEVQFDASDLASGVYFYQMQTAEEVHLKKMLLLK